MFIVFIRQIPNDSIFIGNRKGDSIVNYYTTSEKILSAMEDIFGKMPNTKRVWFSVDFSQQRKLSTITVQVENYPMYHALFFIYTRSNTFYDVLKYRNKVVFRMGQLSKETQPIQLIRRFIDKKIPRINPVSFRQITEDDSQVDNLKSKIEFQKNQIEMLKNKNRSYRDETKNLRKKIQLLRKD